MKSKTVKFFFYVVKNLQQFATRCVIELMSDRLNVCGVCYKKAAPTYLRASALDRASDERFALGKLKHSIKSVCRKNSLKYIKKFFKIFSKYKT
jgi:hypothetical protein